MKMLTKIICIIDDKLEYIMLRRIFSNQRIIDERNSVRPTYRGQGQ